MFKAQKIVQLGTCGLIRDAGVAWASCKRRFKGKQTAAAFIRALEVGDEEAIRRACRDDGDADEPPEGDGELQLLGCAHVLCANKELFKEMQDPDFAFTKCHILLFFDDDDVTDVQDLLQVSPPRFLQSCCWNELILMQFKAVSLCVQCIDAYNDGVVALVTTEDAVLVDGILRLQVIFHNILFGVLISSFVSLLYLLNVFRDDCPSPVLLTSCVSVLNSSTWSMRIEPGYVTKGSLSSESRR